MTKRGYDADRQSQGRYSKVRGGMKPERAHEMELLQTAPVPLESLLGTLSNLHSPVRATRPKRRSFAEIDTELRSHARHACMQQAPAAGTPAHHTIHAYLSFCRPLNCCLRPTATLVISPPNRSPSSRFSVGNNGDTEVGAQPSEFRASESLATQLPIKTVQREVELEMT